MIDEKKIQNGIKACFDRRIDDKVERDFMRDPLLAYTRAFNDAIGWFKKAIWHDASEKPNTSSACLVEVEIEAAEELTNTTGYAESRYDAKSGWCTEYLSELDYVPGVTYEIKKWCYIEDILPKGGKK